MFKGAQLIELYDTVQDGKCYIAFSYVWAVRFLRICFLYYSFEMCYILVVNDFVMAKL
jgi:hypothetical protein